jgi:hypothetical protein
MSFPEQAAYPENSQATTVLVLGILGLVCCGPLGIVAWVMGQNEVQAIDAGRRDPTNRGTANAGRILGIVGTVLFAIGIVWLVLAMSAGFFFPFLDT